MNENDIIDCPASMCCAWSLSLSLSFSFFLFLSLSLIGLWAKSHALRYRIADSLIIIHTSIIVNSISSSYWMYFCIVAQFSRSTTPSVIFIM